MNVELVTPFSYTDDFVVDCARVSYSKRADQFKPEQNAKLIKYLLNPPAGVPHWAPFAGPRLCFLVTMPTEHWMTFFSVANLAGFSWQRVEDDTFEINGSLWAWMEHINFFPALWHILRHRFRESTQNMVCQTDWSHQQTAEECRPSSPVTMYESLRIKAPIFVARQLVKHQVHLVWSEVSRRYVQDAPELYLPAQWHKAPTHSKQGASEEEFGLIEEESSILYAMKESMETAKALYEEALKQGLAPEEARLVLPHNLMTEWIWTGSIRAFQRVCRERLASSAQGATRECAKRIFNALADKHGTDWRNM